MTGARSSAPRPDAPRPDAPRAPSRILFACDQNAVRSPMAAAIARRISGNRFDVRSVGVRAGRPDPFMVATMEEVGIDLSGHRPRDFDDLDDLSFDLVISLSPEAHHRAVELTRDSACGLEYWPTEDPTLAMGSRETILDAYRAVRDKLTERIKARTAYRPRPSG